MPFVTGPHVLVRQRDARNWTLEEDVVYAGRAESWLVPAGTGTDFASVPRFFVWLVPPYGLWTPAAVLHDHLWRTVVPAGGVTPLDADGLFRRAMRELGVPFLLRWYMWAAVRWGALSSAPHRRGWLRELPRVLLITLLALPVVALPALAIAAGLGLFALFEGVGYVVLLVLRRSGRGPAEPPNRGWTGLRT